MSKTEYLIRGSVASHEPWSTSASHDVDVALRPGPARRTASTPATLGTTNRALIGCAF